MREPTDDDPARRARHFAGLERRLFEVLGGWVPSVPEPDVKLVLRAHSFQHAWHADLWAGLLPGGGAERASPLGPAPKKLAEVLEAVAEPQGTLERLVGAYRVLLPHLVSTYSSVRGSVSTVTGGPLARSLGLMLADDVAAWSTGERLVQGCLTTSSEVERAAAQAARVESLLVSAGGLDSNENL